MKGKLILISTLLLFLAGCTAVSGYFDNRALNKLKESSSKEDVIENIQWAVERLGEKDEYAPKIIVELLPISRQKAELVNLDQLDPTLYNQLIERYKSIALSGVSTTDLEDWKDAGYEYEVTNDYLRASAAYQLGRLKGDAIASQLLVLLRKLDSPAIQAVLLRSMIERVDAYKKNDEIRAQAISALSSVDIKSLKPDSVLASQLAKLESELVTLPLLNRVLSKQDIYQLSDRNLAYILDLNEGVWLYLLANPDKIEKNDVVQNTRLLSALALPQTEQLDGTVPNYTVIEQGAQRLLLQYVPGLYYFSMFNHAKTSDYSFGQLVATKEYMDRYETYAIAAGESLVAKGDEGKAFFNHHQLMNKTIYSQTAQKVEKMVFSSLYKRVETRPIAYVDFIYSYLNVNYSKQFANYLLDPIHKKYRSAGIDMLQHYYALILLDNEQLAQETKQGFLKLVQGAQLTRTLNYKHDELKAYIERVYPTFIEKNSPALLSQLHARYNNVVKQDGFEELTDYYIVALDKIEVNQRGKYLNFAGAMLAMHHPESTKKLMGAYRQVPLSNAAYSLENIAFKEAKSTPAVDYLYLGNYVQSRQKELDNSLVNIYAGIFNKAIASEKSDEAALNAAQQGMINFSSKRAMLNSAISKRMPGVEL